MRNTEGQANWRWQPPRTRPSVLRCLEGSTPSPSALHELNDVSLTERQRCQPSKLVRWVRLPQDTLGDRLKVGYRSLKPTMEVRILLPES